MIEEYANEDKLVTDDLRSYGAAALSWAVSSPERGQWRNNRARTRTMDPTTGAQDAGVQECGISQRFLSVHAATYNTFNVQRHLISAKTLRSFRASAMRTSSE